MIKTMCGQLDKLVFLFAAKRNKIYSTYLKKFMFKNNVQVKDLKSSDSILEIGNKRNKYIRLGGERHL